MLSIIIPTIGRHQPLLKLLSSIAQQIFPKDQLEVLVVFNQRAPTFQLPTMINETLAIKTLVSPHKGVNHARNIGAQAAHGDILIFIDDDCLLTDNTYLQKISDYHAKHISAMAIGGSYHLNKKANFWDKSYHFNLCQWLLQQNLGPQQSRLLVGGNASYKRVIFDHGYRFTPGIIYGGSETPLNAKIFDNYGPLLIFDDLSIEHQTHMSPWSFVNKAQLQGRGYATQTKMAPQQIQTPRAIRAPQWRIKIALIIYDFFFMVGFRTCIQERRYLFVPMMQELGLRLKKPFSKLLNGFCFTHSYVRARYANRNG